MCIAAAAAVPIATLVLSAAGTAYGMYQNNQSAKYEAAQYDAKAEQEKTNTYLANQDRQRRMKTLIAQNQVKASGSGVDNQFGSPVDVAGSIAGEYAREKFADDYNTDQIADYYGTAKKNTKTSATAQNVNGLFDFGNKVLTYSQL